MVVCVFAWKGNTLTLPYEILAGEMGEFSVP